MIELSDVERLLSRFEGERVAVRLRRNGRWIHGLCLAVSGLPTTALRPGVRYLLIEVDERAGVEEPKFPQETAAEREARFAAVREAIHVPGLERRRR
jgi:hypothetical protein